MHFNNTCTRIRYEVFIFLMHTCTCISFYEYCMFGSDHDNTITHVFYVGEIINKMYCVLLLFWISYYMLVFFNYTWAGCTECQGCG